MEKDEYNVTCFGHNKKKKIKGKRAMNYLPKGKFISSVFFMVPGILQMLQKMKGYKCMLYTLFTHPCKEVWRPKVFWFLIIGDKEAKVPCILM